MSFSSKILQKMLETFQKTAKLKDYHFSLH